jgi:uncharacterized membrane protein
VSLDTATVAAIIAMAVVTYATRIAGYALVRRLEPGPRTQAVLDAVPGCVLVAVIAPAIASGRPADALAGAVTLIAALRLPMPAVVLVGIGAAALFRTWLG